MLERVFIVATALLAALGFGELGGVYQASIAQRSGERAVASTSPQVAQGSFAGIARGAALLRYVDQFEASAVRAAKTIGVEIEGAVPASLGERGAALSIARALNLPRGSALQVPGHLRTKSGPMRNLLYHVQAGTGDTNTLGWKVMEESTVGAARGYVPLEVASPVLSGAQDWASVSAVLGRLRHDGFSSEAASNAALHIHVGFDKLDTHAARAKAKLLLSVWSEIEQDLVGQRAGIREFRATRMLTEPEREALRAGTLELDASARMPTALAFNPRFGTAEFRSFDSTVDVTRVKSLSDSVATLVRAVESKDPRLIQLLQTDTLSLNSLEQSLELRF